MSNPTRQEILAAFERTESRAIEALVVASTHTEVQKLQGIMTACGLLRKDLGVGPRKPEATK